MLGEWRKPMTPAEHQKGVTQMSGAEVRTDAGLVANSAAVISHAFSSPSTTLVIERRRELADEGAPETKYPPTFNYLLVAVIVITILCGAAVILLAFKLPNPTDLQKQAFAAMDFGWKAGLGAIFGLLTGKET
jgi:hypothetical protein